MIKYRTLAFCLSIAGIAGAPLPAWAQGVLSDAVKSELSGDMVWLDGSGGALTRAREETVIADFTEETGLSVRGDFNQDMVKFFAAMDSGAPIPWSMIEFPNEGDFLRARERGYIAPLDPAIVDRSKLREGSSNEYGVNVMRYGTVFTYNTESFPEGARPTGIRDLYDLERFPGKRCLFNYPQFSGVLESALLADGVAREDLYPLDVDRALKKLDTIKSEVIWWGNGDEGIRLLSSGECSMGISWSGRVYNAVTVDSAPLAIEWQDSLSSGGLYAVPVGAPNPAAGQAMIQHFISDTEGQKKLVAKMTYATDLAALDLDDYDPAVAPWIVAGATADKTIVENAEYYSKNLPDILDKFNRWMALN